MQRRRLENVLQEKEEEEDEESQVNYEKVTYSLLRMTLSNFFTYIKVRLNTSKEKENLIYPNKNTF